MISIRNKLTESIIFPFSDAITGNSNYRIFKFLLESQYWSREQLEEYQTKLLNKLIHHAYSNVPFYRDLMDRSGMSPHDVKSLSDLKLMPIVTKDQLRKAGINAYASNMNSMKKFLQSSSGSTGEPFQFYINNLADGFVKSSAIRAWYWHGYRLGDKYIKLSMNPRDSKGKIIQDFVNNCRYLSTNQLTEKNMGQVVDSIASFDPKYIRCYPVPLSMIAEIIKKRQGSYKGMSLKAINTTGSTLHTGIRKEIEETFGVPIFDSYSCEGGANFSECPVCGMYHPSEEYAISEFISDVFTQNDIEHSKRHITTDLYNYASPFIRYDSQDYVVDIDDKDSIPCVRSFKQIKKIKGRDSDILITPSGKYLIVENFVAYFEYVIGVDLIQVHQLEIDKIDINIVVNASYNNITHQEIEKYWKSYIGNDVIVRVNVVEEIKLTPTGKRQTVIRDKSIKINV